MTSTSEGVIRTHAETPADGPRPPGTTWTSADRTLGRWACYLTFTLSLVYIPVMLGGFAANGNFDDPIADPYLAGMELLILPLAVALVVLFSVVHSYAPQARKTLSLSALAFVTLAAGITICVHIVVLTAGHQIDAGTLPGYDSLLSWNWPSVVFALDIASWDFCLGAGLILAAPVFCGPGLPALVRRGLFLSGALCLAGLIGAPLANMGLRNIGIAGYAVVLPVVLLVMARLFANTPVCSRDAVDIAEERDERHCGHQTQHGEDRNHRHGRR